MKKEREFDDSRRKTVERRLLRAIQIISEGLPGDLPPFLGVNENY
jgi:hypothetical protein